MMEVHELIGEMWVGTFLYFFHCALRVEELGVPVMLRSMCSG